MRASVVVLLSVAFALGAAVAPAGEPIAVGVYFSSSPEALAAYTSAVSSPLYQGEIRLADRPGSGTEVGR